MPRCPFYEIDCLGIPGCLMFARESSYFGGPDQMGTGHAETYTRIYLFSLVMLGPIYYGPPVVALVRILPYRCIFPRNGSVTHERNGRIFGIRNGADAINHRSFGTPKLLNQVPSFGESTRLPPFGIYRRKFVRNFPNSSRWDFLFCFLVAARKHAKMWIREDVCQICSLMTSYLTLRVIKC